MKLSPKDIQWLALGAGFTATQAPTIVAIAQAESGGETQAKNVNKDGSIDRGLLQINDRWHPEVFNDEAYDSYGALQAAYAISKQGTDFTPWTTYTNGDYLLYMGGPMKLNAKGEVADLPTISQFYPSKTQFACGFYAAACLWAAGRPGTGPRQSNTSVEAWADNQYKLQYGRDDISMLGGVSIDDMHRLLVAAMEQAGATKSHYFDLRITGSTIQTNDLVEVDAALSSYYPVVTTVTETSIFDLDLGTNPYFWGASGTHVIVIVGKAKGCYLVHDTANITGALNGPNIPRPMPRRYDINRIAMQWASMVRLPWLAPFPDGWDYTKQKLNQ